MHKSILCRFIGFKLMNMSKNKLTDMKILPVIVIYNSVLQEQLTYKTLLTDRRWDKFVVYDNSSNDYCSSTIEDERAIYIRDKNNSGLSTAYNFAAKIALNEGYDWLLILDQDTCFSDNAYLYYTNAITDNPNVKLFAPIITLNNGSPFSPSKRTHMGMRGIIVQDGVLSLHDYMPVNSGLCVHIPDYIKCGGYNEKIHLDFSDFCFLDRFEKYNKTFCVIKLHAFQTFSNNETNVKVLLNRYDQYINDFFNYFKTKRASEYFCLILSFIKHTMALSIKTKSLCFLIHIIKKYI